MSGPVRVTDIHMYLMHKSDATEVKKEYSVTLLFLNNPSPGLEAVLMSGLTPVSLDGCRCRVREFGSSGDGVFSYRV